MHTGDLEMTFGESFAPKALSRTMPTPIALRLWSRIESTDGSVPPPFTKFVFDTDTNSAIDVRGLPTCSGSSRQIRELNPIRGCDNAIVGEGTATFDIHFPDASPTTSRGKLILYNSGSKAGVTELFAHTYLTQPITFVLTTPIQIEEIDAGRFTSRATFTLPKIANGDASLTSFNARIGRNFVRRGKRVSVLTAKCPDGRLHSRAQAFFGDGTKVQSKLVRSCTPRD